MLIKLGDWVKCKRSCDFVYQKNGYKTLVFYGLNSYACVIGVKKKATGKYVDSKAFFNFDGGGYEPAYLKVDKYHWVYECRSALKGVSFYVMPEDIEYECV